ncbi:MAG: hypothetical protein AB1643_00720 [Patescibacteria group bacterium]
MQIEGENKIGSSQEEIEILKKRIAELERISPDKGKGEIIKEVIKEHSEKSPENLLSKELQISKEEAEKHKENIINLSTEPEHQRHIQELLRIAQDKGILNAISIVRDINDPHLEDEFHDALIPFIQSHNV